MLRMLNNNEKCIAISDFKGRSSDELNFKKDDAILLDPTSEIDQWAQGYMSGSMYGWFPVTFVNRLQPSQEPGRVSTYKPSNNGVKVAPTTTPSTEDDYEVIDDPSMKIYQSFYEISNSLFLSEKEFITNFSEIFKNVIIILQENCKFQITEVKTFVKNLRGLFNVYKSLLLDSNFKTRGVKIGETIDFYKKYFELLKFHIMTYCEIYPLNIERIIKISKDIDAQLQAKMKKKESFIKFLISPIQRLEQVKRSLSELSQYCASQSQEHQVDLRLLLVQIDLLDSCCSYVKQKSIELNEIGFYMVQKGKITVSTEDLYLSVRVLQEFKGSKIERIMLLTNKHCFLLKNKDVGDEIEFEIETTQPLSSIKVVDVEDDEEHVNSFHLIVNNEPISFMTLSTEDKQHFLDAYTNITENGNYCPFWRVDMDGRKLEPARSKSQLKNNVAAASEPAARGGGDPAAAAPVKIELPSEKLGRSDSNADQAYLNMKFQGVDDKIRTLAIEIGNMRILLHQILKKLDRISPSPFNRPPNYSNMD